MLYGPALDGWLVSPCCLSLALPLFLSFFPFPRACRVVSSRLIIRIYFYKLFHKLFANELRLPCELLPVNGPMVYTYI